MVRNLVLALLLPACSIASAKAERDVALTVDHVAGSKLVVQSQNGTLRVQGDPHLDKVQIEATLFCRGTSQVEADARVAHAKILAERVDGTLTIRP